MTSTLRQLALKYGTDKGGHHEYCEAYELFLGGFRNKTFNLVEFGVGGADDPNKGGASLRMWFEYFPKANIHALDIHPKNFKQARTRVFQGSQDDQVIIDQIFGSMPGAPLVIIDDASHINPLTLTTFNLSWGYLAPGGIYVIEDVHTSYWPDDVYKGGGDHGWTVMNYFKMLTDSLNEPDSGVKNHYGIESITFYKEIIFIRKKA